jgi:hypothetical protein
MNSELAYETYVALKLHFNNDSYDYFKYAGKVTVSRESYESRNDKLLFNRACKLYSKDEYVKLLVSNFICDPDTWIGDIISDLGKQRLLDWKKIIQSIKYTFKQDLIYIDEYLIDHDITFNDLFKKNRPYPLIVTFCIHKNISLESFVIMNLILNFVPRVDKLIDERILWNKYKLLSKKYVQFIVSDNASEYKKLLVEKFYRNPLTRAEIKDTI